MSSSQHPSRIWGSDVSATLRCTLLAIALPLALGGCDDGATTDLQSYVKAVLAREGTPVKGLPAVKPYELASYEGSKDPFAAFNTQVNKRGTGGKDYPTKGPNESDIRLARGIQELETHALDSLRMLGSVEYESNMYGLVRDPNGIVHNVKVGDYMGHNYGQIKKITEAQILLTEKFQDSLQHWQDRSAALVLTE